MARFAEVLARTGDPGGARVTYAESHDEAGNAPGSRRTASAAVNGAPLVGPTRRVAEARCRVAAGLALLSAGTPMFLMGEEVVAQRPYRHDDVVAGKEDLVGERHGEGARMFRFTQDLTRLRRAEPALRSRLIDVVHAHDAARVVAFTRRVAAGAPPDVLVVACLRNHPFGAGYVVEVAPDRLPDGDWHLVLDSDAALYGGDGGGDARAVIPASGGRIELALPANGLAVLRRAG
jgi:1,4-alpha-glucan branching enzyme